MHPLRGRLERARARGAAAALAGGRPHGDDRARRLRRQRLPPYGVLAAVRARERGAAGRLAGQRLERPLELEQLARPRHHEQALHRRGHEPHPGARGTEPGIDIAGDNSLRSEGCAPGSDPHDDEAGASSSRLAAQMAALESDIRLTLPARPENVAVVRHVLGALAGALGLPPAVTDDMRLAVTEACANVVQHAYPDDEGTIDVHIRPSEGALDVVVSDSGRGIGPSLATS